MAIARSFTSYSLPRALGQVFQVAVLWMDTLIISAILGTTDAGIYAAGTRYLLIGLFTAEAIMQVIGPRISALLAVRQRVEAAKIYSIGAAWQTALTWSVYLIVIFFSTPLLQCLRAAVRRGRARARVAGVRDADLVAVRAVGHHHLDERPEPVEPLQRVRRGRDQRRSGTSCWCPTSGSPRPAPPGR